MDHYFNFQGNAVVGVMAFLGTCFALAVAAVAMVYLLVARKIQFARVILLFAVAGIGLYVATLFAFSLTSRDLLLGLHSGKNPCEKILNSAMP